MNTTTETSNISIMGHVVIRNAETGEVLLNKHNDINFKNFARAVATLLVNEPYDTGNELFITHLALGNGGSVVDATGNISYKTPNTHVIAGQLYNETLLRAISSGDVLNNLSTQPDGTDSGVYNIVTSVLLDYDDADLSSQNPLDSSTDFSDPFVFDELGLKNGAGNMLTHIVFHPIEKSENRQIEIEYTLRIRVGS